MSRLDDAVEKFLSDFVIGHSPQSVLTYRQSLKRFGEFIGQAVASEQLTVDHALGFAHWLNEERARPITKNTFCTHLSAVASFYAFLCRERVIVIDTADLGRMREAYRKYRKGNKRGLPKLPPAQVVTALLDAARAVQVKPDDRRGQLARLRNIALLEMLRSSGMRVGELVRIRRGELDYHNRAVRVTGKGNKERMIYFDAVTLDSLREYLKAREDGATGRVLAELPLFAAHGKRAGKRILPIVPNAVRMVFNELAQSIQLDVHVTPHSLRHAFATHALEVTNDLAMVQDMLGHDSPVTTRIYAKVSQKRMKEAHQKMFGDNKPV